MPVNLRRMSRARRPKSPAPPAVDPRTARALGHLLGDYRARVLPTDRELDRLAEVQPADIDRAESLWDAAQQRAGTGLDGLLSAVTEDAT